MYTKSFEQYFRPVGSGPLAIEVVSAAAAVHGEYACLKRCVIKRILFVITTAVAADATLPVVEMNRRPTIGSAGGEILIGDLTLPDLTAISEVIFKDIDPVVFNPGDGLSLELAIQAVDGGGATGAGLYGFEIEDKAEEATESPNMVKSV